jgi:hypothetical protein
MKYLLFLICLVACSKHEYLQEQLKDQPIAQHESSQTNSWYLYIPEQEDGYEEGTAGLFTSFRQIGYFTANQWLNDQYGGKLTLGARYKKINYGCPISNGIPGNTWDAATQNPVTLAGTRDLVVNADGSESIAIQVTTYAHGGVYLGRKKSEYDYAPTNKRLGAVEGQNYSGKDYLWWGWYDMYYNDAIIPDADGKYVIAVSFDYDGVSPKASLLPINVVGTTVTLDTTAIYDNAALPATNYKAVLVHGKNKGVKVTFTGDGYAYCLERDGQMIFRWQDVREFFDPNGTKNSKYKIYTRAQDRIPDNWTPVFSVTNK